jgi:hypothetical protein
MLRIVTPYIYIYIILKWVRLVFEMVYSICTSNKRNAALQYNIKESFSTNYNVSPTMPFLGLFHSPIKLPKDGKVEAN